MTLTRVNVGLVSTTFYYVPLWIAMDRGIFRDAGLDVQLLLLGNREPGRLLYDRQIDVAIAPPDGVLQDVEQGGTLCLLAGNSDRLSHCLITQPEIRSVEEMRGKRFGILSRKEGSFFHFQAIAQAHGLAFPQDYQVVETGGAPLRHKLLLGRQIDAGLQSFPWVYLAEQAGFNNVCDVSDYLPEWQFNTVNAERGWIKHNQDVAGRFIGALREATDFFYTHREASASIASARMDMPVETSLKGWDYFAKTERITRDLSVNARGLALVHAALQNAGLIQPDAVFGMGRFLP